MPEPRGAPRFLTEPLVVIAEMVRAVEPDLAVATITTVAEQVTPTRARQRQLARALAEEPALLTSGRPRGPRAVERLIRALLAAGATNVRLARCPGCGRSNPLVNTDADGQRICGSCFNLARSRMEICGGCGRRGKVVARDRHGTARCYRCPPEPDVDHIAVICGHVRRVAGDGTDTHSLRALVEQAVPQPFQRREVAWELDTDPALLTGQAAHGSVRLIALVELLAHHQVPGIAAPACPFCGRNVTLKFRRDDRRCCRRCYDAARKQVCASCGATRPVATRGLDGQPQCDQCHKRDPINHERCTSCGRAALIIHREQGQLLCRRCWRGLDADCSLCGQRKPCYYTSTTTPRCQNCSRKLLSQQQPCSRCDQTRVVGGRDADGQPLCGSCARRRESCCRCNRKMLVIGRIPEGPLCKTCYKTEPAYFQHCIQCGVFERLHHFGLCQRCACPPLLNQALAGGQDGQVRPELEPVVQVLLANDPHRLLVWLAQPGIRAVMAALAAATGPVTHETLDHLEPDRSVRRLRDTLVAARFLPERDEYLARLERWIDRQLDTIDDDVERNLLRRFVTWHHLRRLRRRGPIGFNQAAVVRQEISVTIRLLGWLRDRGKSLSTCAQADVDAWLAEGNTSRHNARNFLAWAVQHKAVGNIKIPLRTPTYRRQVLPETDQRWSIAKQLLHDDQFDTVDRVAGLLLLLYAQPMTKIIGLTTEHVVRDANQVQLLLGRNPLTLPAPLDELVLQLVQNRRGYAVLGRTDDHPWLFPGGAPGRHMSAQQLIRRFQRLGIPARLGRNTALIELASELPTPVISHLLGLNIRTATRWATAAGNTHNGYAAALARRHR